MKIRVLDIESIKSIYAQYEIKFKGNQVFLPNGEIYSCNDEVESAGKTYDTARIIDFDNPDWTKIIKDVVWYEVEINARSTIILPEIVLYPLLQEKLSKLLEE